MSKSPLQSQQRATHASATATRHTQPDSEVFRYALNCARDGVSISDARQPDLPLIYVNQAFELMTGYTAADVLGKNCRFLQGADSDQSELTMLRDALAAGESCIVTFRNYRKDGVLFYNELSMAPIHNDDGDLTHYIGIQKDVTRRVRAERRLAEREVQLSAANAKLAQLAQRDSMTGLFNRRTIDECLDREWRRNLRDPGWLSVYMVDIDNFKAINDEGGHAAGDECIVRLAKTLEHVFCRGADYIGRYGGDEFIIINAGLTPDEAAAQGRRLIAALRLAKLPAAIDRMTISAGVATTTPTPDSEFNLLTSAADKALYKAKRNGRDRLEVATLNAVR